MIAVVAMNGHGVRIHPLLYPLAGLYGCGVRVRNWLFDRGIWKSRCFPLPVICIGNLAVGGTGKTPHTEYLIRLLQDDYTVAVLSRGYRRKTKGFVLASPEATAVDIGDEPYQMAHKFPGICVAVDGDRCHGIEQLLDRGRALGTEVILLDDAFQHRYVKPGISLLLTDYRRPFFADALLPAGRLREPASGKRRADVLIVTKCPSELGAEERNSYLRALSPLPHQQVFFTTLVYGALQPLFATVPERRLETLRVDEQVLLLTGIAAPGLLIEELSRRTRQVTSIAFADHHDFSAADLQRVEAAFRRLRDGHRLVITTEKDASRLVGHQELSEELKAHLYVLPIEVAFLNNEQQRFNQYIKEYVRENTRGC